MSIAFRIAVPILTALVLDGCAPAPPRAPVPGADRSSDLAIRHVVAERYADAIAAYTQALALVPNDLDSMLGLKKAQAALAAQVSYNLGKVSAVRK